MKMHPRDRLALSCSAALTLMGGCKSLESGAVESFATEFSCPETRVLVRAREDLEPYLAMERPSVSTPPAEVAADPARLAKWKADQDKQEERARSWANDLYSLYDVGGCGHAVVYGCYHPGGSGGGRRMDRVSCKVAKNATPRTSTK